MMKKIIFAGLFGLLLSCSSNVQSGTWTVRSNETKADYEYTIINEEDFNRLLKKYEATGKYCVMAYTDALEMEKDVDIISGERPDLDLNEYYYLMVKIKFHNSDFTEEEQSMLNLFNMSNSLIYGNSSTGAISLGFTSSYGAVIPDAIEVNSDEYSRKYNQFIGFVRGENY